MSLSSSQQLKKTAKHSAIYAIATILPRLTALVMLPIYTRYLETQDYGAIEFLTMAIDLFSILVGLQVSLAMFRYFVVSENEMEKKQIVSTTILMVLFASTIGALILYFFAAPISITLLGTTDYVFEFELFAFTLITSTVYAVCRSYLRALEMPWVFVAVSAGLLFLQVTFNVIFVVVYEMHVTGVVYAALISGISVTVPLTLFVFYKVGFNFSSSMARRLFKFVYPLLLAAFGGFYVTYADKYFLRIFTSLSDVGLYALAGRVASVLLMVFEAFNMTWGVDRFQISKRENAREIFASTFRYLTLVLVIAAGGICVFSYDLFLIMTTEAYYPAASIVPIIVMMYYIKIYSMFFDFGIHYAEQTKYIAQASIVKSIVATILFLTVIPLYGAIGAALVLLFSHVIEMILIYRKSTRLYDMGIKFNTVSVFIIPMSGFMLLAYIHLDNQWIGMALHITFYWLITLALYFLPIWSENERQVFKNGVNLLFNKIKHSG